MELQTKTSRSEESAIAMANVFDDVWSRFMAREGTSADTPENRGQLAARIVVLFRTLEADDAQIANGALIYLCALAAAKRIGSQDHAPTPAVVAIGASPGASFAPETIDAMAQALAQCLDELPLRIPSDAQVLLRTTILNAARGGERDADRMHAAAMQALRARQ